MQFSLIDSSWQKSSLSTNLEVKLIFQITDQFLFYQCSLEFLKSLWRTSSWTILNKQKILNNRQFGFCPGLNTFDAINVFTTDLHNALNNHKSIIAIFFDFSKAFDTVWPRYTSRHIHHYGICGCVQNWFKSYLTAQSQFSSYSNSKSAIKPIYILVCHKVAF